MDTATKWLLGIAMALLNCALSSIGFILQRKSHLMQEAEEVERRSDQHESACEIAEPGQPAYCRPMWVTGVVIYILAAAPDVYAYTLVPQVVCSCVACFRLVVITVLAHFVLHEHVRTREIIGIFFCSFGTFLVLCFGPRREEHPNAEAGQFYHAQVFVYLLVAGIILMLLILLEHLEPISGHSFERAHTSLRRTSLPVATGLAFGLEKVFNTELGFLKPPQAIFDNPAWTAMAAAIAALGLTDFYLNIRGAKRMPVQVFVPMVFALSTSVQYFQSVFIFGELEAMSTAHAALSILGAALSLVGALTIQPPRLELLHTEAALLGDQEMRAAPTSDSSSPSKDSQDC